jgi:hypothetical protein
VVISLTSSKVTTEQGRVVEEFLADFLPRVKAEQPGVVAVYHFSDVEAAEQVTAIVWEDEAARVAYRQSELINEALELEQRLGLASKRRAYPLTLALH